MSTSIEVFVEGHLMCLQIVFFFYPELLTFTSVKTELALLRDLSIFPIIVKVDRINCLFVDHCTVSLINRLACEVIVIIYYTPRRCALIFFV